MKLTFNSKIVYFLLCTIHLSLLNNAHAVISLSEKIVLDKINGSTAGNPNIFSNGFEAIPSPTNQVILGPLADAEIRAYKLSDLTTPFEGPITSLNGDINTTGEFDLELLGVPDDEWILVSATGGNDIDSDDDGVLDASPTPNFGTIYALAKASDWREGRTGGKHITALTDISWRYTKNLLGLIQPSELIIRLNELAQQLIQTDINGDSSIDYLDILAFVPNNSLQRAKLNFDYQKLHDLNVNNESYILATHAGATELVESILDKLFAHTLTRQVEPDHRYNTIVIDISVFGNGTISSSTTNKSLVTYNSFNKSKRIYTKKQKNQSLAYTALPAPGYYIYNWIGCDSVSIDLTECFVNQENNHDVIASFASTSTSYQGNFSVVDLSQSSIIEIHNAGGTTTLDVSVSLGLPDLIASLDTLVANDIVASVSNDGGFISQVISITPVVVPNIKRYIIETQDVALDELINQGTGILNHQLTNGDLIEYTPATANKSATISSNSFTGIDGVKLIPKRTASDTTFTLQFGNATNDEKLNLVREVTLFEYLGNSLKAQGSLDLDINLDTGFNYSTISGLEDFKFITKITASEGLKFTATGELTLPVIEKKIGTIKFSRIKFVIGVIPVWITPKVDLYFNVEGKIKTAYVTEVSFDQTITGGVRYTKNEGRYNIVKSYIHDEDFIYPSQTVNASIEMSLKAEASMLIYDITGPAISISPYIRLDSSSEIGGDAWYNDQCIEGTDVGLSLGIKSEFRWIFGIDKSSNIGEFLLLSELEYLSTFEIFDFNKPLTKWHISGTCSNQPPYMYVEGNPIIMNIPYSPQSKQMVNTTVTLTNQGDETLDWTTGYNVGTEIQVTPSSGTLNTGQSTVVDVTLETNGLPVGRYINPLLFENLFDTTLSVQDSGTTEIPILVDILPVDNINIPTITQLTSTSAGLVDIQWSFDPNTTSLPLNSYHIYSSQTPVDPNSWQLQTILGLDTTSQTLSGFTGGANVSFYLQAHGNSVSTLQSPVMSVIINGNVPLPATTNRLNDSGINWGGDAQIGFNPPANNLTCFSNNISSEQDCHQGRDATHNDDSDGNAGFSFTKLDINGNSLSRLATSWTCVRDNVTGFVWEVKTDNGGINDKDNIYRWGGISRQGNNFGLYYNDWDNLVNSSNSTNFCGFNDWKVPTTIQLETLVDFSSKNPTIDPNYFPNTISAYYWSSSPYTHPDYAWKVSFGEGSSFYGYRESTNRVRLISLGNRF